MNPLTNMKNVLKLSEQELRSSMKTSWHDQYKHSAWIFVGGLPFDLTEGDIICVFSQYGEVVNLNLVRDKGTGKSRGFCFVCYEDQRSTNLAVDNFNGIKLLNRTIRVDHCEGYKAPKDDNPKWQVDEETRQLHSEGCAPGSKFGSLPQLPKPGFNGGLDKGPNLPPMESLLKIKTENEDVSTNTKAKKTKKEKKTEKTKDAVKKLFKNKKKEESSSSSSSSSDDSSSESDDEHSQKTKKKLKRKKQSKSSSSSADSKKESNTQKKKKTDSHRSKNESSSDYEDSDHKIKKAKQSQKKYQQHNSSDNEFEKEASVSKLKGRLDETRPNKFSSEKFEYHESSRTDLKAKPLERKDVYPPHGYHKGQKDYDKGRWNDRGREENWRYENERKCTDDRREDREKKVEKGRNEYRKYDGERRYRDERKTGQREDYHRKHSSSKPY